MPRLQPIWPLLFGVACYVASEAVCAQSPEASPAPQFSAQEQQARRAVMESVRWQTARKKFDDWLKVQVAYDDQQKAAMKERLTARIAGMGADELKAFLVEMEMRLDVLLNSQVASARSWADGFYTPKGKQELAARYGAADPIAMTADELNAALARFSLERQSHGSTQAAFRQQQATQATAARQYRQEQQAAAQQAAAISAQRRATNGSPYAPTRPERPMRYQAPYNPLHYSIGPWGGIWVGH